ncbi:MAG TPA: sulfotransferase [Rhodanobacteraceae bacterium]|nr:sulfotransferase [Rhodanobacteraceae bacterium]
MIESTREQWQRVRQLIAARQREPARTLLASIVSRDPADTAAHLHLAGLLAADDHQRAAVAQTLEACRHPPADPNSLGDLIAALIWAGEMVAARRFLDSPVFTVSRSIPVLMRAAGQRQAIGEHATALDLMEQARKHGAGGRDFLFHHAVQLAFNGRLDEARAELEQCIGFDPPLGYAFVELARMHKQSAQSNHLGRIDAALHRVEPGDIEHAALEFARYKELEDLQRHGEAWQALERGNRIMQARLPFDPARQGALIERLMRICTTTFLEARTASDDKGPQPIFVLGLPRSGTTVLERMLGSHSQIASAGELGDFPRALFLATDHLPAGMFDETTLERLPGADWDEVRQTYFAQTRWRAGERPFYVDKLPRNWMVTGLIRRALPQAKILHVVRDPLDACFSNWRAFFGPGAEYAYAYDLAALAAQHRQYRRLMDHWHAVAPGSILDVHYASLVREPEATARAILAFCGLPYEPGCLDFANNTAPSATLSMSQVGQSIRTDAFEAWRPYAGQLAGLRDALAK